MKGFTRYLSGFSIENKIFVSNILIIIVSISTLAFFANNISQKAIIEKAVNNSSRELVLIDNNLKTLRFTIEDYSKILASDFRLQNVLYNDLLSDADAGYKPVEGLNNLSMNKTLSETMSNIVEPNTKIKAVSILTAKNQWVDVGFADNDYAARIFGPMNETAKHSYLPVWTGLIRFKFLYEGEDNVFAVSKTVIHKDTGKTIGRVVLYVKESVIASIYESTNSYKGGEFYILDRNGKIISSQNKANLYRDFAETTSIPIPLGDHTNFIQGRGNHKVLVSTNRFEPLQWSIVSVIPIDEITVELKEINRLIMSIGVLCLLLAFIVSFRLSRSITRPIFQLSKTIRRIRKGELNVRSTYQSTNEIGYLSDGFNSLMDQIEALMAEIVEKQKTKSEVEFKLLQSQVKPHFLYNTVETIISLIKLNMKSEAISAAKYMADFYKISLSKGNDVISIREELRLTESYLEIQQLRYVEYMEYTMHVEEEILNGSIPKLTLQPIVENAIYHGLKMNKEKGVLQITGRLCYGHIQIEVYDNGAGMDEARTKAILMEPAGPKDNSSFGARSVHNRIVMLYGYKYGLEIESVAGYYTKVIIRLPLPNPQEE
ncbi:cache domain-containing sensor histidine kinase [Paenibacillus glycinis]|uniref:HAMP domain-containing protein n=1 Tax=Paenibacillus glycinis TaxID=2697035 RepID=A0ABW9XZ97_9BACL|nr:sensor histidine kinase [Paenibacillus glycinis]NBD28040.1 HAMP domain-containing protein [Paenibacillus glycinis]